MTDEGNFEFFSNYLKQNCHNRQFSNKSKLQIDKTISSVFKKKRKRKRKKKDTDSSYIQWLSHNYFKISSFECEVSPPIRSTKRQPFPRQNFLKINHGLHQFSQSSSLTLTSQPSLNGNFNFHIPFQETLYFSQHILHLPPLSLPQNPSLSLQP